MADRPASRSGSTARRTAVVVGVLVLVVLAVAGRSVGRAEPTGNYRPPLVADPLRLGCYPLPSGVHLDFPYVVRRDGDVATASGARRSLVLQWSLLGLDEVRERLREDLGRAGFEPAGHDTSGSDLSMKRPDAGGGSTVVVARLHALANPSSDPIVRGELELDLPVVELSSTDPACANPFVTKRFEESP